MLTLDDVIVGKAEKVDQQVVDTFRRSSELLDKMVFDNSVSAGNGSTLSYGYVQLKTPSPAGRRNINEEYTAGEAKKEKKSIELDVMGGSFEIDRVLDEAQPEEVSFQMEQKIKSTTNYFHNQVINGDVANVAGDKFDGLNKLVAGTDTEFESESDLSVLNDSTFKVQAMKVCEELDTVLKSMADTPDYIIGNAKALIKLQSAARVMGYLTQAENAFGKPVPAYNGIPFLDLKEYVHIVDNKTIKEDIIKVDEQSGKTDIYFVKLGRDALCGVTINGDKIIRYHLPDFTEAKAVHTGDVEFVAGIALKNSQMAGALRDLQIKPALTNVQNGNYNSGTSTWTQGTNTYNVRLAQGNVIKVTGTIPYAEADATLGLDAGNRVQFRLSYAGITSQAQLPSGDIMTAIGKTATNTYTKSAFESDGSLINVGNVYKDFTSKLKITWTAGKEVEYTIDTSDATFAEE